MRHAMHKMLFVFLVSHEVAWKNESLPNEKAIYVTSILYDSV